MGSRAEWPGNRITSLVATSDTAHLTELGIIQNNQPSGSPIYSSFNGVATNPGDILIRWTRCGDANLGGIVDGYDHSLIDNGYLNNLNGWFNGYFNYDGVVDGSDDRSMDNAFNQQEHAEDNAQMPAQSARSSTVPEPARWVAAGINIFCIRRKFRSQRSA